MLVARPAVAHLAVPGDQNQTGRVGVDGARDMRGESDRGDQLTGCKCTAALVFGQQHRCHRDGFGDRTGNAPVPESFGGDDEVDRMRVDAVEPLRHRQRRHAEVCQRRPDLAAGTGVAGHPRAHRRGNVGRRERSVDARGEVALLFVEIELHCFFPACPRAREADQAAARR